MTFGRDTRGVSEVIGAILMFGLIIMLLAILQTQAIPAANADVEFNHNDELQGQLVGLHESMSEAARNGGSVSTSLDMGTQYPARMLFFNPAAPAGTLRTTDEATVTISNAESLTPGADKYFAGEDVSVTSRSITYRPGYNEYESAPETRYEHGVLYNDHGGTQQLVNDGGVIQGTDITLLFADGELDETTAATKSLDVRPVSAPSNPVTISGDGSGPLTITLPSQMNESLWNQSIDDTYVEDVTRDSDTGMVEIELNASETYSLRMAKLGVGDGTNSPDAKYLYPMDGERHEVMQGQSKIIDVELRDRYNNPVANENISWSLDGSGSIQWEDSESGPDGTASVQINAPSQPGTMTLKASLDDPTAAGFEPDTDPRDLEMDVTVTEVPGGYGSEPTIDAEYSLGCGPSGLGDVIDNPIDSISGDDVAGGAEWTVTHDDPDTDIDTVDIRLIRETNNQVADSVIYAYDEVEEGEQTVSGEAQLVDADQCNWITGTGNTYKIRVLVQTTGGATAIDSEPGLTD